MKIRKAAPRDIPDISVIYEKIHAAEENGYMEVGWKRDVYPTENTARNALHRDDLFVLLDDTDTRIDTNAKNARARQFYNKLGYSEAGIVQTSFNGLQDVDLVLLEKKLLKGSR